MGTQHKRLGKLSASKEIEEHFNDDKVTINIASDRTCYILGEKWKGAAKKMPPMQYTSQ